jgi:pentapeptide MXKDX repeat protein
MMKRLGRGVVIAVVGVVFGLAGVVGESVAQDTMKKGDTMKMDDKMKTGDTMMKDEKKGDMKADDMKKDGKAMMKDDKMMPGEKRMEKKQ